MRRFFSDQIEDEHILLDEEESRHIQKVLRLQPEDQIEVIDGKGNLYIAEISEFKKKQCIAKILDRSRPKKEKPVIWLAVAPTKNINRWEWFLEKSTEIGIQRISPILCDQSERKVLKEERQKRILKEALKQSQQLVMAQLAELQSLTKLLSSDEFIQWEGEKFIAHCSEGVEKKHLKELHKAGENALILIGPEGDFSENEIKLVKTAGFKEISLGESRLRTETAAIVACSSLNLLND